MTLPFKFRKPGGFNLLPFNKTAEPKAVPPVIEQESTPISDTGKAVVQPVAQPKPEAMPGVAGLGKPISQLTTADLPKLKDIDHNSVDVLSRHLESGSSVPEQTDEIKTMVDFHFQRANVIDEIMAGKKPISELSKYSLPESKFRELITKETDISAQYRPTTPLKRTETPLASDITGQDIEIEQQGQPIGVKDILGTPKPISPQSAYLRRIELQKESDKKELEALQKTPEYQAEMVKQNREALGKKPVYINGKWTTPAEMSKTLMTPAQSESIRRQLADYEGQYARGETGLEVLSAVGTALAIPQQIVQGLLLGGKYSYDDMAEIFKDEFTDMPSYNKAFLWTVATDPLIIPITKAIRPAQIALELAGITKREGVFLVKENLPRLLKTWAESKGVAKEALAAVEKKAGQLANKLSPQRLAEGKLGAMAKGYGESTGLDLGAKAEPVTEAMAKGKVPKPKGKLRQLPEKKPEGAGAAEDYDAYQKSVQSYIDDFENQYAPKTKTPSTSEINAQMRQAAKAGETITPEEAVNRLYMEKPQRALKEAEAFRKPTKFKGFSPARIKEQRIADNRVARLKARTEAKLSAEDEAVATVIEKRIVNQTKKPYIPYTQPLFSEEPKMGFFRSIKTIYDKTIASAKTVIRGETASGAKLMDTFDDISRKSAQRESQWLNQTKDAKNLSLNEQYNVADVLEGYNTATNDKASAMAQKLKSHFDSIGNEAQGMNIQVKTKDGGLVSFAPREDYFPHWIPTRQMMAGEEWAIREAVNTTVARGWADNTIEARQIVDNFLSYLRSNGGNNKFLQNMVAKGQATSTAEARHIMEVFVSPKRARKFGSLEYAREADLPFYVRRMDKALPRFYEGTARRLEEISAFGQKNKDLFRLIDDIGAEGGDVKRVERLVNELLGNNMQDQQLNKAVAYFTDFQVMGKMGLSALTNMTQVNNALARTNLSSMIKAFKAAITTEGRDFAFNSGAVLEAIQREMMAEIGTSSSSAGKFLKWSGFNGVEAWNRIVSANAGKFYAEELLGTLIKNPESKFARRRLKELIPHINVDDAIKSGVLTKQQLYDAGFKASQDTQFLYRMQDLPELWQSRQVVRLMTQFKSFGIQQKDFIKQFIVGELFKGNPKPLIYLAVGAGLTGEAAIDIKNLILGRSRKDMSIVQRVLDNILLAGGVGILTDAIQTAAYGKGAIANWLVGPTAADLGELSYAAYETIAKGKLSQAKRQGIRLAPGVAGKIYPPVAIGARIGGEIYKRMEQEPADITEVRRLYGNANKAHDEYNKLLKDGKTADDNPEIKDYGRLSDAVEFFSYMKRQKELVQKNNSLSDSEKQAKIKAYDNQILARAKTELNYGKSSLPWQAKGKMDDEIDDVLKEAGLLEEDDIDAVLIESGLKK
ncbi:MAG: hypothetical protein V1709_08640 [Planctomycetota bacterium]